MVALSNFKMQFYTVAGNEFMVLKPVEKMSDAMYDEAKASVEKFGGHWRESLGGFCFGIDKDLAKLYSQDKEDNQYFPTPKDVADRMVQLSGIHDYVVDNNRAILMEPSAGRGRLLDALPDVVKNIAREYVVEPDERNVQELYKRGHIPEHMTFEEFYEKHKKEDLGITHILMNPPFSKGRAIKHTRMAYDLLNEGGVLVGIIPENILHYDTESSKAFVEWLEEEDAYIEPVEYGAFRQSGTMVDTVVIKIVKE